MQRARRTANAAPPIRLSEVAQVQAQPANQDLVQRRRQQIVDAAVDLFSHKGFEATTVGEIASAAGISTGLIYHYARTKEDVLFLVLLTVLDSYQRDLPPAMAAYDDPLGKLVAGVRAYCVVIDQKMDATLLAYRATKALPREQRAMIKQAEIDTNTLIEDCIRDGIEQGQFRPVEPAMAAYQFVSFAHTWALKAWRLQEMMTLEVYVASGLDLLMRGITTASGWRRYQTLANSVKPAPAKRAGSRAGGQRASRS
jgi:AcrR family transcriptional regulator